MDTKERIITESLKLFMRYGIRSVTMDTIAEHLGISKRTIYELFKDKNDLLDQCITHIMLEEEEDNRKIVQQSANLLEAFLSYIQKSINTIKSINPMFFHDAQKYHSEVFRRKGKEREEKDYHMIVGFIKQGKQEGYIIPNLNEDIIAKLMQEQFMIMGNDEIFPSDKYSKAEIFKNIAINFIRGISTTKGILLIDQYQYRT